MTESQADTPTDQILLELAHGTGGRIVDMSDRSSIDYHPPPTEVDLVAAPAQNVVPEPSLFMLVGIGLAGIAYVVRRSGVGPIRG